MSTELMGVAFDVLAATLWEILARNWALASIVATVAILIITPVLILGKYIRLMLNLLKDTPPPLSMGPRDFSPLEGEPVQFRALDGLALRGMLVRGRGPEAPKGLIIFAHEYASDRHSCARYCRPLIEAGYDVFSFDFRGHGDSSREPGYQPRQWVTDRELADIQGAIGWGLQWLEQQGRPAKVGLFGISRGACAAILAAAGTPQVQAIVADGAFSSDTTLEALMKRWASIFAKVRIVYENHPPAFWRFLRWLLFLVARRQLNCRFPSVRKALLRMEPRPMLFIHGERDSYIPVEQTRMLYALAGQPKYLWIVPTAKHNQSVAVQPKRYAERTVAFFNRYLAEVPTEDRIFPGRFRSPDELEAAPLRLEGARQAQVG